MQIHLLEGFHDDEVFVRIAGSEQRLTGVSTREELGVARSLVVAAASEHVQVDIALPRRGLASSITVERASEASLRVSITKSGELELRTAGAPHQY